MKKKKTSIDEWKEKLETIKNTPIKDFKITVGDLEVYNDTFLPSDKVKEMIIFDVENKIKEDVTILEFELSKIKNFFKKKKK